MDTARAVIFDIDGVLVDSYRAHFDSWQRLCQEEGLELTEEQFVATFGHTSREIISRLWGNRYRQLDQVRVLDDRKEALYREILQQDFPKIDGAAELVQTLYDSGIRLGVGSSGPPSNVFLVLDSLGVRAKFRAIVTGTDVQRGKPDPQVFKVAAERLGVAPNHCVVLEDAPAGVAAARLAGMKCIALLSTGRTRDAVPDANRVVESLREITVDEVIAMIDEEPAADD